MSDNEKLVHELTMLYLQHKYLRSSSTSSSTVTALVKNYYETKTEIEKECSKYQENGES